MSVVIGETPKQQPRDSALTASDDVELAASFPFSITLWVYFDEVPGENETHTISWYGEGATSSNHVRLEATKNQTSGIDLTAVLAASAGTVSATATQLPTGTWIMATVIVEEVGGASHRVTLYIDATEEDSQTGSVGTTAPADYDLFLLGAARGGSNFGRFRAEHVAIWAPDSGTPLSPSNIAELYDERWAPFAYPPPGAPTPPLGRVPGIAYWMLAGHWSAGIEAGDEQVAANSGLLFNQANPGGQTDKPPLEMLDTSKPVVWSAKTPVMRYKTPEQEMDPGPIVHPPIPPVSRLQPLFYVFNTTGPLGTFKYAPLEIPVYTHPNFVPKGITAADDADNLAPLFDTLTGYLPRTDVSLLAKRIADWFEFTGLTSGVGSVGNGDYEGYVFMRTIGLGDLIGQPVRNRLRGFRGVLSTLDPDAPFTGTDNAVPLELHPLDRVEPAGDYEPNRPWHTWFNVHGKRLLTDYMDSFWTALKRELDERNLCYPRVLWWDQEDWAHETEVIAPPPEPNDKYRGTFTLQLGDARATAEQLMDSQTHGTLSQIWNATKPPEEYDDDEGVTEDANLPFLSWYLGWSIPIGQQAMLDAMMEKAKELFPLTVWSNYDRFSADNPQFRYQGNTWRMAYNTPPADQAEFYGDYSSPKLYTPNNLNALTVSDGRQIKELGVTWAQVMRNCHKSRIDACINAHTERPLVPWMETGSRRFTIGGTYDLTDEDVWDVFAYAWKRGVCEFIPFVWEGEIPEEIDDPGEYDFGADDDQRKIAHDRMYDVCFRLLNTVHWMPQENHGRVARVSRRGW